MHRAAPVNSRLAHGCDFVLSCAAGTRLQPVAGASLRLGAALLRDSSLQQAAVRPDALAGSRPARACLTRLHLGRRACESMRAPHACSVPSSRRRPAPHRQGRCGPAATTGALAAHSAAPLHALLADGERRDPARAASTAAGERGLDVQHRLGRARLLADCSTAHPRAPSGCGTCRTAPSGRCHACQEPSDVRQVVCVAADGADGFPSLSARASGCAAPARVDLPMQAAALQPGRAPAGGCGIVIDTRRLPRLRGHLARHPRA